MTMQTVNALELVMLIIYTTTRLAASAAVVYFLCNAEITNGWKVFLIALAIVIGFGFNVKYKSPNDLGNPTAFQKEDSSVKLMGTK